MKGKAEMKKNVCVIGAGASGLIAVKELLEEGHSVTCFERGAELGGVFRAGIGPDEAGAYDSTMLTISNYMMAFSCFPPPGDQERRYWSAAEYRRYLVDFTEKFDLAPYLRFRTDVVSVSRSEGGGCTVETAPVGDPTARVAHHFDAVVISTGTHRVPKYIDLPGQSEFAGEIVHSAYYRNARPFRGKRVLCIGIGETAADVVNEIAQTAATCTLSVRRYQPVMERYPRGTHTNDAYTSYLLHTVPLETTSALARLAMKRRSRRGRTAAVRAVGEWNSRNKNIFREFITKNEAFLHRLVDGSLTVNASGIERLGADYVQFKDGRRVKIDTIMLNTGYMENFDILNDIEIDDVRKLYKHMIHPDLGTDIVLIGWARPATGGVPACSEMQARYFALLCSGKKQVPDRVQLQVLAERQAAYENAVFHPSPGLRTLVHYTRYMSDFSRVIGCSPWRPAVLRNPRLAYRLWCGSQMPCMYRLFGPHSDPGTARKTIMSQPPGFSLLDALAITAAAGVSRMLIALGLMKADPTY
jgi:dimethylaniline monooxygenase (N-oxide forming)